MAPDFKERSTQRKIIFEKIKREIESYRESAEAAITTYEKERDSLRKRTDEYKASETMYRDGLVKLLPAVRTIIGEKATKLSDSLLELTEKLSDNLLTELCLPVPAGTQNLVSAYRDNNLKPTRTEVEALSVVNAGHYLGNRIINAMLEKNGSPYRIESRTIDELQQDVEAVRQFANDLRIVPWIGLEHIGSICELYAPMKGISVEPDEPDAPKMIAVFAGQTRKRLIDGELVDTGATWDSVSLSAGIGRLDTKATEIDGIRQAWANIPQFPEIVQDQELIGVAAATEAGRQKAETEAKATETVEMYAE